MPSTSQRPSSKKPYTLRLLSRFVDLVGGAKPKAPEAKEARGSGEAGTGLGITGLHLDAVGRQPA